MKQVIINDNDISIDDIEYEVVRVKALIIDSNYNIILVENNHTYQFPGGHNIKGEALEDTLSREIREELGINIEIVNGPFMMITTYDNNYFESGYKVLNKIYYFVIHTDIEPDRSNLILDKIESQTSFNIIKIKLDELDLFLNKCINDGTINANIHREMGLVLHEYNNLFGGIK